MTTPTLAASPRVHAGRKTYHLRNEGFIPAVVYGAGIEPKNIQVDRALFTRLFKTAGESTLVELALEGGAPLHVLIQDVQLDPLRDEFTHADFRVVDMTKKTEAEVKLHFVGEAPAVKALGGTLVRTVEEVRVEALPKDLVSFIEVDLSKLVTFEDAIHLKDLSIPAGVEFLDDMEQTVAIVAAPRSEEELADLNKAVEMDVTAVEKVEKEKKGDDAEGNVEAAK
jgi:large subunit ribosomal protein L25